MVSKSYLWEVKSKLNQTWLLGSHDHIFSFERVLFDTQNFSSYGAFSERPCMQSPRQNLIDDTKRGSGPTPKLRKSVKGESLTSFHRFLKVHDFSPLSGKYYWNFSHSTNSIWPNKNAPL